MPDVRIDPLTGDVVVVAGSRQGRPTLPSTDCPFCVGGLEAPDPYDVHWFKNRWPALDAGKVEVVLFAPEHDASLASLGTDKVQKVVALWAERTAALSRLEGVEYVLVFENRGADVGATIPHPHGQIYAFDFVPAAAQQELTRGECALCHDDHTETSISTVGDYEVFVPRAAKWPYELLIAPRAHVGALPQSPDGQEDLAGALVDGLGRLDRLFDAPMPYMLWIHQAPVVGEWPNAHLHAHVAPILRRAGVQRYVAAGELGSGVFFNPIVPEDAAEQLRNA